MASWRLEWPRWALSSAALKKSLWRSWGSGLHFRQGVFLGADHSVIFHLASPRTSVSVSPASSFPRFGEKIQRNPANPALLTAGFYQTCDLGGSWSPIRPCRSSPIPPLPLPNGRRGVWRGDNLF